MDKIIPVRENIYWIGANDYETDLFEGIWPLPHGVSYNAYLINDDKVAVIDTVKRTLTSTFFEKIRKIIGPDRSVDYLVVNHMEPDHSGAITALRRLFPNMKVVGNAKTIEFLKNFYGTNGNELIIKDGDMLDLGKHKLQFHITPMVHWPETMMTYETTSKMLFSGDAFGGFGTLDGGIFDDEVDINVFIEETRRYFSNIVGKYSLMVQKAFQKLAGLDIKIIGPTHGPVYRTDPQHIIKLYDKWSKHETEKGVVIAYASMYGNTQTMIEAVARALAEAKIHKVKIHNVSKSHLSYIMNDIWEYKGLILGSCTYNMRLFPPMESLVTMLENDQIKNHVIGIVGSYTWSGGALTALQKFAEKSQCTLIQPTVEARSGATEEDLKKCEELGKAIAAVL
ncbi:MAG: FprA family A-type flavoprotein [Candidatus Omnitrophica bacterium]|nr:FprA family A-type flavoprotein [Candidatus Omnitrophota bacterium]